MAESDLSTFIVAQLEAAGVRVSMGDSNQENIKAFCFRGHDHKTPSLSIRRLDGAFLCFGCGVKGSKWDYIANYIKVDTLTEENRPNDFLVLAHKMEKRYQKAMAKVDLPWGLRPWTKPWRRLRVKTLKRVGAFGWFDDDPRIRAERILFPVMMYDEVKGWVARRLDEAPPGEKLLKPYRNAPNMSSKDVLFPLDAVIAMNRKVVVLVEGPYDALRLVNYNIPALAIMGTRNYDDSNRTHLINANAEAVVVAMDGDEGGEGVRYDIAASLMEMFPVKHFMCPEKKDPGNMPMPHLNRLYRLVKRMETTLAA